MGPNDSCPCGSGKKFKRCHRDKPLADPTSAEFQEKAWALFDAKIDAEQRWTNWFGRVKPLSHTKAWGKRLVLQGSRVYFIDERDSFHDFLRDMLRQVLGEDWWAEQMAKPLIARHPIAQWQAHADELMSAEQPDERGRYSITQDGPVTAYLTLAYDLHVVRDNVPYQERLFERLRSRSDFAGTRYELRVAAIFVRAGFMVEPEDESDGSTRHPEFIASDRRTGFSVAVEAKSRNRRPSDRTPETTGVYDLIEDAVGKKPLDKPYVLFVNVAMAPGQRDAPPNWTDEVDGYMKEIAAKNGGTSPFDLAVFTNIPEEYGTTQDPNPSNDYVAWMPRKTRVQPNVFKALESALRQSGRIPEFEMDA